MGNGGRISSAFTKCALICLTNWAAGYTSFADGQLEILWRKAGVSTSSIVHTVSDTHLRSASSFILSSCSVVEGWADGVCGVVGGGAVTGVGVGG